MEQTLKILGQQKPGAGVNTNLFTVSTSHQVQVSIFIANQMSDYDRFTVALIPSGQSQEPKNYLAYSTPLSANGVMAFSGIYLNDGDSVFVSSEGGQCSFTATGIDFGP